MVLVHFGVGFAFTRSWVFGGALAFIDLVLGLLVYYYHERLWSTKIKQFGKVKHE
jgi:uncharacterized membrane protein